MIKVNKVSYMWQGPNNVIASMLKAVFFKVHSTKADQGGLLNFYLIKSYSIILKLSGINELQTIINTYKTAFSASYLWVLIVLFQILQEKPVENWYISENGLLL